MHASSKPGVGAAVQHFQYLMQELRADPVLSKVLDKPSVQAAFQALKKDPSQLPELRAADPDVAAVLDRLLEIGMSPDDRQRFEDLGASPTEVAQKLSANPELTALLRQPRVRAAMYEFGTDADAAVVKYAGDLEVFRALQLLDKVIPSK